MSSVHLLVLIHGMWGHPGHLAELDRIIRETYPAASDDVELEILLAETNREDSTYDGIDWGGERVAQEVVDRVEELKNDGKTVSRFSATGYSLGGLVARYVVGILHQRNFFEKVTPVNFNTIATPHIGLPRYSSLISSLFSSLGPKLLSRTGEQFYCVDQWSATGRPLLEVMADPDRIFYKALSVFQHIRIYANAVNDVTVPYVTSAIEVEDPFAERDMNGLEVDCHEQYGVLIKSFAVPSIPPPPTPKPIILSPTWFRTRRPGRPLLPPVLQLRFPLNIVLYALLPVLIPLGISLIVLRFSLATRSSRARIRLLEQESKGEHLIHVLAQLEKDVEIAVAELIDDPNPITPPSPSTKRTPKPPPEQPILTPLQRKIAASLNTLPIKKELAYIENVRNSHAVIVCRDVKRFEGHRQGEGIIRHWAASFTL
ncbi:hypothetical protein Hypma_003722 [Hypsizygus marmoreus]|uniref:DUF676 domain-containing protein n=1 Tax=Hypsizygus marmoreus TaxID=39966 RepID=A0A369J585_HYPMA|nr:hypothetical protein Hypma_003722 [Hypsizygus marmoreus]